MHEKDINIVLVIQALKYDKYRTCDTGFTENHGCLKLPMWAQLEITFLQEHTFLNW
jgi:hypothetical protein